MSMANDPKRIRTPWSKRGEFCATLKRATLLVEWGADGGVDEVGSMAVQPRCSEGAPLKKGGGRLPVPVRMRAVTTNL